HFAPPFLPKIVAPASNVASPHATRLFIPPDSPPTCPFPGSTGRGHEGGFPGHARSWKINAAAERKPAARGVTFAPGGPHIPSTGQATHQGQADAGRRGCAPAPRLRLRQHLRLRPLSPPG